MSDREGPTGVDHPFDQSVCPFCGTSLDERGVGFVEHLRTNDECRRALSRWQNRRSEDAADDSASDDGEE